MHLIIRQSTLALPYTVYAVNLTVILIWQFGEFIFIHQIKCTHCLHSSVSIHDLDSPCYQTKYPPIYITYQFAKLYVHQRYRVYGINISSIMIGFAILVYELQSDNEANHTLWDFIYKIAISFLNNTMSNKKFM